MKNETWKMNWWLSIAIHVGLSDFGSGIQFCGIYEDVLVDHESCLKWKKPLSMMVCCKLEPCMNNMNEDGWFFYFVMEIDLVVGWFDDGLWFWILFSIELGWRIALVYYGSWNSCCDGCLKLKAQVDLYFHNLNLVEYWIGIGWAVGLLFRRTNVSQDANWRTKSDSDGIVIQDSSLVGTMLAWL